MTNKHPGHRWLGLWLLPLLGCTSCCPAAKTYPTRQGQAGFANPQACSQPTAIQTSLAIRDARQAHAADCTAYCEDCSDELKFSVDWGCIANDNLAAFGQPAVAGPTKGYHTVKTHCECTEAGGEEGEGAGCRI